jgi:glutamine amidotransferase
LKKNKLIGIINYGLGNLGSIQNMIKKVNGESIILNEPSELHKVDKLILPGVGAFDRGMRLLNEKEWVEPLNTFVLKERKMVLGICLGMQLMTRGSEEGVLDGLSWVKADTKRFRLEEPNLKVPHMGWNISYPEKKTKVLSDPEKEKRYYFVHSYYVEMDNPEDALFTSNYGDKFVSGYEVDNILGMQFHPEKSHKFGMEIMRNFINSY